MSLKVLCNTKQDHYFMHGTSAWVSSNTTFQKLDQLPTQVGNLYSHFHEMFKPHTRLIPLLQFILNKEADLGLRPMCLHITYMTAAPIKLYSMINGKRYGAESCTIEPMMLTRPQVGTEPAVPLLVRASGNRLSMFSISMGVPEPDTEMHSM